MKKKLLLFISLIPLTATAMNQCGLPDSGTGNIEELAGILSRVSKPGPEKEVLLSKYKKLMNCLDKKQVEWGKVMADLAKLTKEIELEKKAVETRYNDRTWLRQSLARENSTTGDVDALIKKDGYRKFAYESLTTAEEKIRFNEKFLAHLRMAQAIIRPDKWLIPRQHLLTLFLKVYDDVVLEDSDRLYRPIIGLSVDMHNQTVSYGYNLDANMNVYMCSDLEEDFVEYSKKYHSK